MSAVLTDLGREAMLLVILWIERGLSQYECSVQVEPDAVGLSKADCYVISPGI
jgi:hypothetical protein